MSKPKLTKSCGAEEEEEVEEEEEEEEEEKNNTSSIPTLKTARKSRTHKTGLNLPLINQVTYFNWVQMSKISPQHKCHTEQYISMGKKMH